MLDPVTIQDLAKAGLLKDETEYLTPLIDKMVDGATTDATNQRVTSMHCLTL